MNMFTKGVIVERSQMNVDTLFINLKVLGLVKPSNKLNSQNELLYIETTSALYPTWMRRMIYGDNRMSTVRRIDEIAYKSSQYYKDVARTNDERNRLIAHLINARKGVANLKKTYVDDGTTTSHLENSLDKMDQIIDLSKEEEKGEE